MKTNRLEATHFIEQYKFDEDPRDKDCYSHQPVEIDYLQSALNYTKRVYGHTVAVFKLKEHRPWTNYEWMQLKKYGNVLPEERRGIFEKDEEDEEPMSTSQAVWEDEN